MNALTRGLNKVTKLGANGGDRNQIICWNNGITDTCTAPLLYPSPKTHKPMDPQGDHKSRPVVPATSCVTSRPGEVLTEILNAALRSFPVKHECLSTEEMLVKVDNANQVVREQGRYICVGSGDVTALYLSLRHEESSKLCGEVIKYYPGEFSNIDSKAAAIFIATYCTQKEIYSSQQEDVPGARNPTHLLGSSLPGP